jgi:hypothetical protein
MKELLVLARPDTYEVNILVPKRRGEGFVKVPLGHHVSPLTQIAYDIGYDIFGLDGSLAVQTGFIWRDKKKALLEHIMPPIAAHYGMPWREIGADEYWQLHPLGDAVRKEYYD